MKNLCIIPARGGSKRIPRKNVKEFFGKPMVAYSIELALKSKLFDEVMVSTDDLEIKEVAEKYGASVPFLRSDKNADDHATTVDVLLEVISTYANQGRIFNNVCCLYPCAPLITRERFLEANDLLIKKELNCVFPVIAFSFPIQRAVKLKNHVPEMFYSDLEKTRSQDLEQAYHDAGQFYFFRTEHLVNEKGVFSGKTEVLLLSELEAQDIDNDIDWQMAELKYKLLSRSFSLE